MLSKEQKEAIEFAIPRISSPLIGVHREATVEGEVGAILGWYCRDCQTGRDERVERPCDVKHDPTCYYTKMIKILRGMLEE